MAREEVQHDGRELCGPAALREENGVRRGNVQLGPNERLDVGEKRNELLGAMRNLGDPDARLVKIEQPFGGFLEHRLGKGRGARAKVNHS